MSDPFKDLMQELGAEYLATFPEKLILLRQLWMGQNREALKTEFHKLRGTGKSYGFDGISAVGALGEELIDSNQAMDDIIPAL